MQSVGLSEKAWLFVESRRGDLQHDDYVSMLIENVADLSGGGSLSPDGMSLIEVIESHQSGCGAGQDTCGCVAWQIIDCLREFYPGKVPRSVFRRKCAEYGMSNVEIVQSEQAYREWLA